MNLPPSNQRGRTPQGTRREQPIGSSRSRSRSQLICARSSRSLIPSSRHQQACWYWEEVLDSQGVAWRKKEYWFATMLTAEVLAKKRPKCPGREASPEARVATPKARLQEKARPPPPPPPAPSARTDASALRSRPPMSHAETTAYTAAEDAPETRAKSAGKRTHAEGTDRVVNGMQNARAASLRDNPAKAGSVPPQMTPPPLPAMSSNSPPDAPYSHPIRAQPSSSIPQTKAAQPGSSSSSNPSSTDEAAPATDDVERYPRWVRKVYSVLGKLDKNIAIDPSAHEHPDEEDQRELASPTPRLLTAGGYNRQH